MRNAGLDILRFVAVLLVIGRHMHVCPESEGHGAFLFSTIWQNGGWIGVDIFFVLSGFLVSGLLFKEFQEKGSLDLRRFLIRRGFKIYPAFWLLLAVTVALYLANSKTIAFADLAGELLFLQNYLGNLNGHTWSLAVEEHFYLGLTGLCWWFMQKQKRQDFAWIPPLFFTVAVFCFCIRLTNAYLYPAFHFRQHVYATHIRMDALLYGVYIAYFYHFRPQNFPFFRWPTPILLLAGVLLLSPAFLFTLGADQFLPAIGTLLFYIGSGFLVIAAVRLPRTNSHLLRLAATLGTASYSIYLWHFPVISLGWKMLEKRVLLHNWYAYALWSLVAPFLFGIVAAALLEKPVLALRDKWFPSSKKTRDTRADTPPTHLPGTSDAAEPIRQTNFPTSSSPDLEQEAEVRS